MEYLQRREKPNHYTWEGWHTFANEQFMSSQKKLLTEEKERDAQIKRDREMAEQMSYEMTKQFLPGIEIPAPKTVTDRNNTSGNDNMPKNVHVKQEKPDKTLRNVEIPDVTKEPVEREKSEFEKTVDLSKATVNFLQEVSDLVMDKDVLFALRKLKFLGKQMLSDTCDTETFQNEFDKHNAYEQNLAKERSQNASQPAQHGAHVRSLDFGGEVQIKQEKQEMTPQTVKPVFSGAKHMSYEQFQENFQSKRKKPGQSPARSGGKGFTSPKPKATPQSYKAMTDSKMDIIASGANLLKTKKSAKHLQALWTEVENINCAILFTQDTNFFQLLAAFDSKYDKLTENVRGQQLKTDLFDFIVSKVEYARVSN